MKTFEAAPPRRAQTKRRHLGDGVSCISSDDTATARTGPAARCARLRYLFLPLCAAALAGAAFAGPPSPIWPPASPRRASRRATCRPPRRLARSMRPAGRRRDPLRTGFRRHRTADRHVQHERLARHHEIAVRTVPRLELADRHAVAAGERRHRLLAAHADQHLARVGYVGFHRERAVFGDVGADVLVVVIAARHDDRRFRLQAHAGRNLVDRHQRIGVHADLRRSRPAVPAR